MEALRNGSTKVASVRQATLRLRALASRTEPFALKQARPVTVPSNGIVVDKQFPLPGNVVSQVAYSTVYEVPQVEMPMAEVKAMECPDAMLEKAQQLFPKQNMKNVSVVNFVQKTENSMSEWGAKMELEFAGLASEFTKTAVQTCEALRSLGYWADFVDPVTGKAYLSESNATLNTTDKEYRSLGFDVADMGCCNVLSHPIFGKNVFVGTIFTNAPTEALSNL